MAHRLLSVMYWCPQSCSCTWSSCWLREFIHVAVVYANEMPLFIGNIEFYIQSTINFYVFSHTGVYASPFGVRSTVSLSLRLLVPRVLQLLVSLVPTGAIFEISDTRPIFSWNFYLYQPGAGSLCLWSCFMIWKDTLFIHNYFQFTFMHIWAFLTFGLSLYV